jgi:hypothetical protein
MNALAQQIEKHLLETRGWVTAWELQSKFGIGQRALRALDGKPGLCSEFAISGNKGFKHVQYATDAEFTRADQRVRKHAIGELISARLRRRYRKRLLAPKPAPLHERATGQAVMPI